MTIILTLVLSYAPLWQHMGRLGKPFVKDEVVFNKFHILATSAFVLSSKQENQMKVKDDVVYIKDVNLLHGVSCKRPLSFV